MSWTVILIILAFIIYGLIGEHNDSKRSKKATDYVQPDDDVSAYARSLEKQYIKAYNSHSEEELKTIVEDMIGYHYSSFSADDLDDCILLESIAVNYPYTYNGSRTDYKGLSLIEIFRKDNDYIRKLKGRL